MSLSDKTGLVEFARQLHARGVEVVSTGGTARTLVEELDRPGGPSLAFKFDLARKAFAHTAAYDRSIASTLADVTLSGDTFARSAEGAPAQLSIVADKVRDLRYGENPHQQAAWYAGPGHAGLGAARVLQGKELSYTNLLDLDAGARIVLEFSEPAAAVIKHTNPCGAATGANAADAYVRARDADALSAFGGIIALNRPIDLDAAFAIVSTRIDAVIAPAVDEAARAVLAQRAQMRVVTADFAQLAASGDREVRSILGAVLVQDRDRVPEASVPWPSPELTVVTRRQPTADEWRALRFAWRVCAHVKSNTIIFTREDRTVAIGAGQMSRVDSVQVARLKAQSLGPDALTGTVVASDAFFPFRDGLDAVAQAGATAVVQPGGSVKDEEVIAAANDHSLAMVFTGRRHFRH